MATAKKMFGNRKFFSLPEEYPLRLVPAKSRASHSSRKTEEATKLIKYIDDNVIGKNTTFAGPYGRRKVVYCDYMASGRSLQFIEDYIMKEVLPCYGNTHTTTSITSLQSTLYRHEARDIVRNAVHAGEQDAVIFAGSGCTGAVHKLLHALDLRDPPVVFVGASEHHSTLLPWREAGALVVRVGETRDGHLDLLELERRLREHAGRGRSLVGCFSAASNVTGIMADDVATTLLLHQHGALAFWDYAAAAPCAKLDMNPVLPGVDPGSVHKDALFFSLHKFVGGVQTPGVLVAKKALFRNAKPQGCGGGSVFFVSRDSHRYLQDTELREEGGTAAIVESVRAGLVMQLKEAVGVPNIMAREHKIARTVLAHVRTIPELILLGSHSQAAKRLPVFSFMVRHPRGAFLHHNFVCSVLNDVFGIQARGGCACAGPYAQDLMGIDEALALEYENVLLEDRRLDRTHLRRQEEHSSFEMLRPGFARISLPYFMNDQELAFVLEALKMVATEAWKLLPQYILNPETGEWRHHTNTVFRERKWLGHIRYIDGKMNVNERRISVLGTFPQDYAECLQTARNIFNKARKMAQRYPLADHCVMFDEHTERLRWFMLPSEAQDLLLGHSQRVKHDVPFEPAVYGGSPGGPELSTSEGTAAVLPGLAARKSISIPENLPRHGSLPCIGPSPILPQFALGAMVSSSPQPESLPELPSRTRCYSEEECLEYHLSLAALPDGGEIARASPILLGSGVLSPVTVACLGSERRSCGSQTDLRSSDAEGSPFSSLINSSTSTMPPQSPEDISAYVKEMTATLATEIKSEIREVISKVDGLLSDNDVSSASPLKELKSECASRGGGTPPLLPLPEEAPTQSSECSSDETVIHVLRAEDARCGSSQDSGINLTSHESDSSSPGLADSCVRKRRKGETQPPTAASPQDPQQQPAFRWHCPPKAIWKPAVEALHEFDMIRDGDRVMVCLSGGKDSLSLLHTLHQYQFYARAKGINFVMGAATVDPGSSAYDPQPLIPYLKALGVHYLYEEQQILEQAAALEKCTSVCSFCSRMKRGRLYAAARANGYNVLALGQHLDDITESFLMSVFHNGRLRTMKAHYYIRERDLRVIRPFIYVREKALRQFAESRNLPVIPENCPACFEAPKERHRSKQLLAQQEILFPRLFLSLRSALHPLISFRQTGEEGRAYSRFRKHSGAATNGHHQQQQHPPEGSSESEEEPVQ